MTILTLGEFVDIVIMSLVIGFIFMDYFALLVPRKIKSYYDVVMPSKGFNSRAFFLSIAVVGSAVLLHEMGHKFTAMFFGYSASFHAAYLYLGIGLILKLIGSPIIFFVPAFVSIPAAVPPFKSAIISFMGPGVNILLWLISTSMYEKARDETKKRFWFASKKINGFLAIFNLLPFPGFDGFHFIMNLIKAVA